MNDQSKTKYELIQELVSLRKRIAELSQYESEQKKAKESLYESEDKYKSLIENIPDIIFITIDLEGKITFISKRTKEILGYENEETINRDIFNFIPEEAHQSTMEKLQKGMKGEKIKHIQLPVTAKSGKKMFFDISFSRIYKDGVVVGAQGTAVDVTERKRTEEKLRKEEQRFRAFVEHSSDIIVLLNLEGAIAYINPAVEQVLGFKPEERIGAKGFELIHPDDMKFLTDSFNTLARDTNSPVIKAEMRLRHKNGSWRTLEAVGSNQVNNNVVEAIVVNYRDITDRKQSEESLHQSEEKYRTILEDIQEGYFEVDLAGNFTFFNDSLFRYFGYSKEELMGMNYRQYTDKEHSKELFQAYNKVYNTGEPIEGFYWQITRKDRTKRYVEASISLQKDSSGKPIGFRGIARDVTEHKKVEEALKKSEEQYRFLADNMTEHVWLMDLNTMKMTYVSPSVEKIYGYSSDEILKLPFKKFLTAESFLKVRDLLSDEIPKLLSNPLSSFHKYSLELEVCHKDGHLLWIEDTLSFLRDENEKHAFLLGETRDITDRKRAEEKLKETLENLRKSIKTTIQVLGTASEARDPYTAGHQRKVADLASAIATEMGLSHEKIEGIRMASSIHDIGKISIPAEILSKPTKLTEIEFSLIKEHSQSGYDMLKDMESPWPLVQIISQHHERMNGSGYPRNLKGDEIIMESRILAVADVVEAMASHRPYRPTLGIEAALEEIEKNKGILFDDAVADACLTLFRKKDYQLP